jgi:cytochrome b561
MDQQGYSRPARLLHWTMALLVLLMIPAGVVMVQEGLDRSLQNSLFIFHKNVGVLLFGLLLLRLIWRGLRPPPPMPRAVPQWQARIAGLTHATLYLLLFVVPVAGYVRVRAGGFPIESLDALGAPPLVPRSDTLAEAAKALHYGAGLAIAVVIALHIGAAMFHGVVKKDGVFTRMWPPLGPGRRDARAGKETL